MHDALEDLQLDNLGPELSAAESIPLKIVSTPEHPIIELTPDPPREPTLDEIKGTILGFEEKEVLDAESDEDDDLDD